LLAGRFPLIGHLQEDQIGNLFHIVAVTHAVIPEDMCVILYFVNNI
jgi:hypothetical protein